MTNTDDAGRPNLSFEGMDNMPSDGSRADEHESSQPLDDAGRRMLRYPSLDGVSPQKDLRSQSTDQFSASDLKEANSLIKEFRSDDDGECDLSFLNRQVTDVDEMGSDPIVVGKILSWLPRIRETVELYRSTPHSDSTHRYRLKSEIQKMLSDAVYEAQNAWIGVNGSLKM